MPTNEAQAGALQKDSSCKAPGNTYVITINVRGHGMGDTLPITRLRAWKQLPMV